MHEKTATEIRKMIIETAWASKCAHVGSAMSCVDILTALYFFEVMHVESNDFDRRDIFVLSKAHAALALYSVLVRKGLMDCRILDGYMQNNGTLPAHLDFFTNPWIEASTGSLGHGFNMALGMAHGYKMKGDDRKVFVLMGDGESQEGSVWEGALFASKLEIDNFTVILDYNNLQGYGRPLDICSYEPIVEKWQAFGWDVCCVDGHDIDQLVQMLRLPRNGRPRILIARTVKGKGVSFMEDQLKWHYFIVTDALKKQALLELGGSL